MFRDNDYFNYKIYIRNVSLVKKFDIPQKIDSFDSGENIDGIVEFGHLMILNYSLSLVPNLKSLKSSNVYSLNEQSDIQVKKIFSIYRYIYYRGNFLFCYCHEMLEYQ